MNFKKLGIRIVIITIGLEFLLYFLSFDVYISIALGVFGIGSGLVLMMLDSYRKFDR